MVGRSRRKLHDLSSEQAAATSRPRGLTSSATTQRLGDLLLHHNLVSPEDLAEALLRQDVTGKRLGNVLVELGMIDDDTVAEVLAAQVGLPVVDLSDATPEADAIAALPERVARDAKAAPLRLSDDVLEVAVTDAMPLTRERLEAASGMTVRLYIAPAADIDKVLNASYQALADIDVLVHQFDVVARREELAERALADADDAPVVRMLDVILTQAVRDRASDIHIETVDTGVRLRFRIDGHVHEIHTLPATVAASVSSRIKIMAGLNIVERRRPQDGQFTTQIDDRIVDVRVSIAPTIWGEKVVLRLLDRARPLLRLQELGMSERVEAAYRQLVQSPFGMVVCAGPTGSGKTTTLYASLMEVDHSDRNVMTIEDPVEYVLPSINQVQLNEPAGVDFASGLRSILRQDPDVILVGEVRDTETARIAVRAALTGHLVLSSLHATDAAAAVHRLVDMEVEPYAITSSVRAVVAQRLIRRICTDCRVPATPPEDELEFYRESGGTGETFYRGEGCNFCHRTGYLDRIGVYEMLLVDENIRRLIARNATRDEIRDAAIETQDMQTLRREGIRLVDEGITTIAEVARNIWTM